MELPALTTPMDGIAEPDLQSLSARVRAGDKNAIPALGRQFESVFLSQLFKEMRQTLEPDGMFGHDAGDALGGIFDMMMGKFVAGAGGIGLAAVFSRQLSRSLPNAAADRAMPSIPVDPRQRPQSDEEATPCDRIRKKYRSPS